MASLVDATEKVAEEIAAVGAVAAEALADVTAFAGDGEVTSSATIDTDRLYFFMEEESRDMDPRGVLLMVGF